MTPYWSDDHLTLYGGDCREVMASMEPESVHCVVTSPPYWGLRDYGTEGQLGLEPTPEAYVANMVAVFREVWRVLRADGTLWLNLGDSYATGGGSVGRAPGGGDQGERFIRAGMIGTQPNRMPIPGLKPKDLVGIPWRVAFALQADGWYLRSDIIWSKPNPMPESVTDRPTKAHEYLFLLSKSPRYYFDADAVREGAEYAGPNGAQHSPYGQGFTRRSVASWDERKAAGGASGSKITGHNASHGEGLTHNLGNGLSRNIRTVWTIATEPYPGAHFATFPRKLVEPCVKAGTSERGVCPECGAPWVRETKVSYVKSPVHGAGSVVGRHYETGANNYDGAGMPRLNRSTETLGWRPSCTHDAEPVSAVVLDPFAGSGTTLLVAQALGRKGVGIDLSPEYLQQALDRNAQTPLGLVG